MFDNTYKERQRKAKQHIEDLLALERALAKREFNFLDDMADQVCRKESLTPGQIKKINKIYKKRGRKGTNGVF